jgi:hypothetical protein
MTSWRIWRLVILSILLAALAWTWLYRSPIGRSSAETAAIETPYKTEHQWAVRETAIDIERMAAYAGKRAARALPAQLPDVPWEPDAFAPLVAEAFGVGPSSADFQVDQYPSLVSMDVSAFVDSSKAVSRALESNMRDPRAHESAALVIGAFALRDAADQFTDVRWALNRMTAHLAVARTLRQQSNVSPDGALAGVIFSTLSNQQARAIAELGALGTGTPPAPLNAWVRALTMRVNQDWRLLNDPASATRLEKFEYFRARRANVRRRRAAEDLNSVGEELSADFARLAQNGLLGVEDGHLFVVPALDLELDEARSAYQRLHGQPMPDDLAAALNHRASYLVDPSPGVLPWGAWAEFYQRHIAMNIGMVDSRLRYSLGVAQEADAAKKAMVLQLGKLTSFPLGTLRWTKGNNATEADMTYVADVVELSKKAPELITQRAWVFFEAGSRSESVPETMPNPMTWFATATARVPFEAGVRNAEGIRVRADDFDSVISAAPTDRVLLISAIEGAGEDPASRRAHELLKRRHDFDLGAIDASLKHEKNDVVRAELQRKGCAISSRDCVALARTLVVLKRDEEAVKEYERGFADTETDQVAFAAEAGWLVEHYRKNGRVMEARSLAERAARVGSAAGHQVRAELLDRLGEYNKAEEDFGYNALNYGQRADLLAFYYRRVEVAHDEAYRPKWNKWLAEVFPDGLQPEPTSMTGTPKSGVFVYEDSDRSKKAGIRAGDIIVGLEGFRVDNVEQYRAINRFFEQERVKLTLWRGTLIKVDAEATNRLFGTNIQTHPLKGWIE